MENVIKVFFDFFFEKHNAKLLLNCNLNVRDVPLLVINDTFTK